MLERADGRVVGTTVATFLILLRHSRASLTNIITEIAQADPIVSEGFMMGDEETVEDRCLNVSAMTLNSYRHMERVDAAQSAVLED